jgi:Holliday junction resolvase RusA-like endonuclease
MTNKNVIFKFDCEPISVNRLYVSCKGAKRFISVEGKKFKLSVALAMAKQLKDKTITKTISEFVGKPLAVNAVVGLPSWLLKNGVSVRKKDIDNLYKCLSDSVFTALQDVNAKLDDSYVWQVTISKKVTTNVEVTFAISIYDSTM